MHRARVLRVCSVIGVHISTLLQVKLGREMELGVIFWICFLYLFHSQLIARMQDSSCKKVFVEWHVDLKLYVGSLQTCSLTCLPGNYVYLLHEAESLRI
jgi:hypothetical protein